MTSNALIDNLNTDFFLLPLGRAATEIQKMCLAEVAVQAEEESGCSLLPHGSAL